VEARAVKKRQPTVNFATQEFRALHGFQPRGFAVWTFYFSDAPTTAWVPDDTPLTFLEAKRRAVLEARLRNVTAVRLDPNPQNWKLYGA
jgi:hypothetical protein